MKLNDEFAEKPEKLYEPSSMISMHFKGNDVSSKTDEEGIQFSLFFVVRNEEGNIKGERFTRTVRKDREGKVLKDHWEC